MQEATERPAVFGIAEHFDFSAEGVDMDVMRYLSTQAAKHPERFTPEPPLSKLCSTAGCAAPEIVLQRLRHLVSIERLIPAQTRDGRRGWVVPLGRDWRKHHNRAEGSLAASGGFTGKDGDFLRGCGISPL